MKRLFLVVLAALALVWVSCSKAKSCRCSVAGSQSVHTFKIDGGDCKALDAVQFQDASSQVRVDTLFCMEY